MCQALEIPQRVQICQLGEVVGGEDQGLEIRYRVREGGLYAVDSVAGEKEDAESGRKGEVG